MVMLASVQRVQRLLLFAFAVMRSTPQSASTMIGGVGTPSHREDFCLYRRMVSVIGGDSQLVRRLRTSAWPEVNRAVGVVIGSGTCRQAHLVYAILHLEDFVAAKRPRAILGAEEVDRYPSTLHSKLVCDGDSETLGPVWWMCALVVGCP